MIYTPMTSKALRIAYAAHHGQVDKAGVPYIHHPLHVAEQMDDEVSTCVALLHDVLEDTDVTETDLRAKGFPDEVVDAVVLLTRGQGVSYRDYIERLSADPLARKVKVADLRHNSDTTRLCELPADMRRQGERLAATRYRRALEFLLKADAQPDGSP